MYGDAELLTRILSQDWVERWEGWPRVQRQFRDMGEACVDAVAEECAERVACKANVGVACKSDAGRKDEFLELGSQVSQSDGHDFNCLSNSLLQLLLWRDLLTAPAFATPSFKTNLVSRNM